MIVAGIGCRRSVDATEVIAAIELAMRQWLAGSEHALETHAPSSQDTRARMTQAHGPGDPERPARLPDCIAIPVSKADEAGVLAATDRLAIRIAIVTQEALEAASARTRTRSARSLAEMNVHSVAEAAALAAAGSRSRLVIPRVTLGNVTCALAESEIET